MDTNRNELLFPWAFLIVGIAIIIVSPNYGLGTFQQPQAGFWPMLMGVLLVILGGLQLAEAMKKRSYSAVEEKSLDKPQNARLIGICICLAAWVVISSILGWILTTFVVSLALGKAFGLKGWVVPLILAFGITIVNYYLFGVWFYVDLPTGILNF